MSHSEHSVVTEWLGCAAKPDDVGFIPSYGGHISMGA